MATNPAAIRPIPIPIPPGPGNTPAPFGPDTTVGGKTFAFIAGWTLLLLVLALISKTRIGYVLIYYSLLLLILFILVTEYAVIAPLLNPPTIGELEAATGT